MKRDLNDLRNTEAQRRHDRLEDFLFGFLTCCVLIGVALVLSVA